MQRFFDEVALVEDVRLAIEQALKRHGIEHFSPLGIGAVLQASASPFKWAIYPHHRLLVEAANSASLAFLQSKLAFAVALAQSPHSRIVNPLMEVATLAALKAKKPLTFAELRRNTLRIHLNAPNMNIRGVANAMQEDASLEPAFNSALGYLEEAGILEQSALTPKWRLSDDFAYAASHMSAQ